MTREQDEQWTPAELSTGGDPIRPMTKPERMAICLQLAIADFDKTQDDTQQPSRSPEWKEYWLRYSWQYLLMWAALKHGMNI